MSNADTTVPDTRIAPEETSLARLLVALPGWRWVPGMKLADKRILIVWAGPDHLSCANDMFVGDLRCREGVWEARTSPHREWGPATLTEVLPDLEHMGTAGILLGRLWAADPDAGWHVHGPPGLVCVHRADGSDEHYGDHLGVAAARALVAIGRCA